MFSRYSAPCRLAIPTKVPPSGTGILWTARRPFVRSTSARRVPLRQGLGTLVLASTLGTSTYLYLHGHPISLDSTHSDYTTKHDPRTLDEREAAHQEPLTSLIRTYIVYSLCSIPWIVDFSPKILDVFMSVPVLKHVAEAFVRVTFFTQFVGGDTAQDTLPILERLREENKGAMLHFGAEVDENETADFHSRLSATSQAKSKKAVNTEIVDEFINCIDVAGDFEDGLWEKAGRTSVGKGTNGRKTSVAIKLTALIPDPNTFIRFSRHLTSTHSQPSSSVQVPFPGVPHSTDLDILSVNPFDLSPTCPLSKEDLESLRALKDELFRMCRRAQERGVVVCIDAEHSWYQPAIEAFQMALMREFNRLGPLTDKDTEGLIQAPVRPLVYGTFQTYLRRAAEHLEQSIHDAEEGRYALGVKLVRGAYHDLETSSHLAHIGKESASVHHGLSISPDPLPPVWQSKSQTDECFNKCARMLVKKVAADIAEETRKRDKGKESYTPKLGLVIGTHNPTSCELVLNALVDEGLAVRVQDKIQIRREAARRLAIGQLYGMCDALSSSIACRTSVRSSASESGGIEEPIVTKYIPYGPLVRVMPYLGRRALENQSVLSGAGGARDEKERAGKDIVKRVKGWIRSRFLL